MKKLLPLLVLSLFTITCLHAQDARDIFKKTYQKCQSVQKGYYEAEIYMRWASRKDTGKSLSRCYFKKLADDTLFDFAYHQYYNDSNEAAVMYTGNELVWVDEKDTATIINKVKYISFINSIKHNYFRFFGPITHKKSKPLPSDSMLMDPKISFTRLADEPVNGVDCYHIRRSEDPEDEDEKENYITTTLYECDFWVRKTDFIPVQYSVIYHMLMNKEDKDTMIQYDRYVLTKFEENFDEQKLTLKSLPARYKLIDYVPRKEDKYKPEKLLAKHSVPPDWNLTGFDEQQMHLKDLKGKVVVLDFFYKGCFPCMKALPHLEALSQKYKDQGLLVVGIDPYDGEKKEEMKEFLAKKGVTYPVLFTDRNTLPDQYKIRGYPTLYILNKKGKIAYARSGFGKDLKEVEKVVKRCL